MFNKIYSKIKEFIKENLFLIVTGLSIITIFNIPIPYYIEAPGGLINLDKKIEVKEGYPVSGSLNLTYVSSYEGSIATYLMSLLSKNWDLVPNKEVISENENRKDVDTRNKLLLENSLSNAYYVAYTSLNKKLDINSSNIFVAFVDENADTDLKVGDKIKKIANVDIKEIEDITNYLKEKNVGDRLKVIVNDNEEKYIEVKDLDGKKSILIYAICNYDYNNDIEFKFKASESGPSGGLMITLSIYEKYTKEDITKGKKIAGTGTIEMDGTVGEISGIKYKIIGASKSNVDVFFVPEANYKEAKKVVEENNYDINLVSVKTFKDAINYLTK